MTPTEQRVLDHLMTLRALSDDEFERVVVCPKSDAVIAEALGLPVEDVTAALYALSDREVIIAEGNANYGPIVAIYKQAAA